MHSNTFLLLSGILVTGFLCQWIAWRVKLPSILFLLLTGILVGPVLGWLRPDELFGDLLEPIVALAVAVILYEGSLTLKFAKIRGRGGVVRNLVTLGVIITWFAATAAAYYFLAWDIYLAALFGAIVTVSGPTVILPLIRTIRPKDSVASILRWEGILVDPIGAILAVLVFEYMVIVQFAGDDTDVFKTLGLIVALGTVLGVVAGHALGVVLRKHWLPDYLRDYAALAVVILVFSVAEMTHSETGLLAVTVMGVWQANMRDLDLDDILDFKESLTLVLVAALFIILAARLNPDNLLGLGAGALLVFLFLQFIAGPLRAFVSAIGSELNWRERLFLGWIFPRGIVAAAVSALFALRLENMGYAGAEKLVPMVFAIIVGTVVVQSLSGRVVARWLGIANPEPTGALIVGAHNVALCYAEALHKCGHQVLVASSDWRGISDARMKGLAVFYGSPVSSYAERHLDLTGIGHLLALSHRPDLNELACLRYRYDLGRDAVYTIRQQSEGSHDKFKISGESGGRVLFGGGFAMNDIGELLEKGAEARSTELTDSFDLDAYTARYPNRLILFVTTESGKVRYPTGPDSLTAPAGSKVTALAVKADEQVASEEPEAEGQAAS
ncbi:MAG TPA: sodium:proton antiporter [Woeseiaceae bacterium]|nr:sodium:proton antiporter [Woeseiaceae bacterium]